MAIGPLVFGACLEVVPHSGGAEQSIPRGKRESNNSLLPGYIPNDLNTPTPPHALPPKDRNSFRYCNPGDQTLYGPYTSKQQHLVNASF